MYNTQSEAIASTVCQSCGSSTITKAETTTSKGTGITYVLLGWMFFAISLLFIPILFGAGAFLMGFMTFNERSQAQGVILMFFAAVGLILGSLYSFMVSGTMFI